VRDCFDQLARRLFYPLFSVALQLLVNALSIELPFNSLALASSHLLPTNYNEEFSSLNYKLFSTLVNGLGFLFMEITPKITQSNYRYNNQVDPF